MENEVNAMQPENSTPEANGGQGRMFSQDELNKIISERLAREREKYAQPKDDEREKALNAREARLNCREYLESNGYNSKLIDVFDTSDFDRFKGSVDALAQIEPRIKGTLTTRGVTTAHPPACQGSSIDAQLAEIFKPKI